MSDNKDIASELAEDQKKLFEKKNKKSKVIETPVLEETNISYIEPDDVEAAALSGLGLQEVADQITEKEISIGIRKNKERPELYEVFCVVNGVSKAISPISNKTSVVALAKIKFVEIFILNKSEDI
jgi:hypothetical protein